jgi:hypothetical protein
MRIWAKNFAAAYMSVVLLLLGCIGCSAHENTNSLNVTLVDLLANPQEYVGHRVSTVGYLANHANLELFLTKEHAGARDYFSSIVVADHDDWSVHRSKCLDEIVELTAVVAPGASENYILEDVSRITNLLTNEICWSLVD